MKSGLGIVHFNTYIELSLWKRKITMFCEKHHIAFLALFGSILTPHFSRSSDVDVLVKFEKKHIPSLQPKVWIDFTKCVVYSGDFGTRSSGLRVVVSCRLLRCGYWDTHMAPREAVALQLTTLSRNAQIHFLLSTFTWQGPHTPCLISDRQPYYVF